VTSSVTVFAKWVLMTCTVTFRLTDHKEPGAVWCSRVADCGSTVATPTAPVKAGCTFDGWYQDTCCVVPWTFSNPVTDDITLYGKWIENHTISFKSEGGSAVAPITQPYGSVVATPVAPVKSGQTFAGWYTTGSWKTPYVFTTMPDSDLTLHAKWTKAHPDHEADPKGCTPRKGSEGNKRAPIADSHPSEETSRTVACAKDQAGDSTSTEPTHAAGSSSAAETIESDSQAGSPAAPPTSSDSSSGSAAGASSKADGESKPAENVGAGTP